MKERIDVEGLCGEIHLDQKNMPVSLGIQLICGFWN